MSGRNHLFCPFKNAKRQLCATLHDREAHRLRGPYTPALLVESVFVLTDKTSGYAIAGAILTTMLEDKLIEYLPESEILNLC